MVEAVEVFDDALESGRDDGLIQRRKQQAGHQSTENNHDLAVRVFFDRCICIHRGVSLLREIDNRRRTSKDL